MLVGATDVYEQNLWTADLCELAIVYIIMVLILLYKLLLFFFLKIIDFCNKIVPSFNDNKMNFGNDFANNIINNIFKSNWK